MGIFLLFPNIDYNLKRTNYKCQPSGFRVWNVLSWIYNTDLATTVVAVLSCPFSGWRAGQSLPHLLKVKLFKISDNSKFPFILSLNFIVLVWIQINSISSWVFLELACYWTNSSRVYYWFLKLNSLWRQLFIKWNMMY